ncbi:HSPB1-associated protein 1 isoform X2 [Rhinatrema bivittatum]|uniref:HSPB1-associated protein 1 isoform X2 n=1 Tax=Rhinatrema bivittatum TaxID=194408 RepID=UPI00112D7B35|nr:HSPB1-associated protein 1 isoform X2 [Rhinatrema bivittatum]
MGSVMAHSLENLYLSDFERNWIEISQFKVKTLMWRRGLSNELLVSASICWLEDNPTCTDCLSGLQESQLLAAPQFETQCNYVDATLEQFIAWSCAQTSSSSGPFGPYDLSDYWAYADYKYMAILFEDHTERLQDVVWSDFGFPGRNGQESTLWIGTTEANTPCHVDSYGCNLVMQVQGRKRWHLFPPEDTAFLYPTRIPYEESSVFSKVNVVNPDLNRFPQFRNAQAHVVTLHPGQVLVVPRHWWHYVESIDPVTVSVNSWIELDEDHEARVEEAITRLLVCAMKSAEDPRTTDIWLNPTEIEATSHEINLKYLNNAVAECLKNEREVVMERKQHGAINKQDPSTQCKKRKTDASSDPSDRGPSEQEPGDPGWEGKRQLPFGVHLAPVLPWSEGGGKGDGESGVVYSIRETGGGRSEEFQSPGKQSVVSRNETPAGQAVLDRSVDSPPKTISTNDLLDCLLNPQVICLVARFLLERKNT